MMINNKPAYANDYRYIVVRECDRELWFWGAWDELDLASNATEEINGIIIDTEEE